MRDIHFVKIFLVSGVWAYVTVALPLIYFDCVWSIDSILYITERALFIFAITLPFDIRDRDLDRSVGVKTIPSALGLEVTLRLAMWILVVWMGLVCYLYPRSTYLAFALSGISTYIFIYFSPRQKQDYYFTALLDGTMFLQVGLLWIIRY